MKKYTRSGARVPLAEVQRAHRLMEKASVSGKIVLRSET